MSNRRSSSNGPPSDDEDPSTDAAMPLTMAASVILTSLPKDASSALVGAGDLPQAKGTSYVSSGLVIMITNIRYTSDDSLSASRLRSTAASESVQDQCNTTLRYRCWFPTKEAGCRARRKRILLRQ